LEEILIVRGAKTIVETCASIKEGEKVFILTDYKTTSSAFLIAEAAYALGAQVDIGIMEPRELDGQEPTTIFAAAMKMADVILTPLSKALSHSIAIKEALLNGARVLSLSAISKELIASPAFQADFKSQAPIVERVAQLFTQSNEITITSPGGTKLKVGLKGRKGNAHHCLVDRPGQFSGAPNIEANFSPLEGTAEGVFVSDASIPYLGIGKLTSPVIFTIKSGRVIKTEGGEEAKKIREIWEKQNDPSVYNVAQVAVGLNPMVKEAIGYLGCNYDEGAFGTVHIGIGTSSNLGGNIKAATHFDALMKKPTMILDKKIILLKDGELNL